MIIKSKNFRLKLEEILKDELPTETYNDTEKNVLEIVRNWYSEKDHFVHHTSGSTGEPKKIQISRQKIEYSSQATLSFIDPTTKLNNTLLCINPDFIGGAMVVYRALINDLDLTIVEPKTDFMSDIEHEGQFDLVSLIPMQFQQLTEGQIGQFKVILIGGAPMPVDLSKYPSQIYATFGMTETVSHVAMRRLDEECFTTTGDAVIGIGSDNSLKIKGTITNHKWLKTNDIITFISNTSFKWLGRKDFIINSGGIKLNPEAIEDKLKEHIQGDFVIASLPDVKLGRKVVLLIEGDERLIDFTELEPFQKPKETFFRQQIFRTATNKLDRLKTQEYFESNL